ncbi:MAG: response regulator transcription factor [Bacteroidota bacterium]
MMKSKRVLIVEDDAIISEDLQTCVENLSYELAGVAYDSPTALDLLATQSFDIVLLDINLGGGKDGVDIAEQINTHHKIPFIFITAYSSKSVLERAKRVRPMGYIVKPFSEGDIFSAMEIALFNYKSTGGIDRWDLNSFNQKTDVIYTSREWDLIKDIFKGYTNQQIANNQFVSVNTVKTHLKNIYDKLNVHTRSEVIVRLRNIFNE